MKKQKREELFSNKEWVSFLKIVKKIKLVKEVEDYEKILNETKMLKNVFFKRISALLLYIKNKNKDLIISSFKEIMQIPKFYFILNPIPKIKLKELEEVLVSILEKIKQNLNEQQYLIFNKYISTLFPEIIKFDTQLSLHEIRIKSKSSKSGMIFASFWSELLSSRVTNKEIKNYINKYFSQLYYTQGIYSSFHLIAYLNSAPVKIRKKLIKYYKRRNNLKEIELIQIINDKNKSFFTNEILKLKKPLFIYQRDFLRKLIKNNIAVDFCIYDLIKLGDFDKNYLIWIIK